MKFLDAIDADDASRWNEIITKELAEKFAREGVLDKVYEAWRRGTVTVSGRLRTAPFHLLRTEGKLVLQFEGVIVANDPEKEYFMVVTIQDGVMYLAEP